MEHVGFKTPEDLVPNISIVKPTVAKLLLRLPKPDKSTAVCSLRCKEDDWPLNWCRQSRRPRQCPPPPACDTQRRSFCSEAAYLITQIHLTVQWETGLGGDLSSKFISTLQAADPESC